MTANLDLWERLGKTDPSHTKSFKRSGGFSGTAIKPMWSYKRMTEEFGPVGQGWGIYEPTFQVVPGAEGEVLVYCTVSIWYEKPEQRSWGVGGDKVVAKNKHGLSGDDEAFKKAFTDAITNALKLIGVGADVHMGMFDDSKYRDDLTKEFRQEEAANKRQSPALEALLTNLVKQETHAASVEWKAKQDSEINALSDADFQTFKAAWIGHLKKFASQKEAA
ncbi:exodeoxyribonuclease VIII [Ochrobactrum sp. MYb68]|nr:exodeoxyribonuclease VIII [Ochrobactrum sp. MYb68]